MLMLASFAAMDESVRYDMLVLNKSPQIEASSTDHCLFWVGLSHDNDEMRLTVGASEARVRLVG